MLPTTRYSSRLAPGRALLNRRLLAGAMMIVALAGCSMQSASSAPPDRFLVYFDEFSANISPVARKTIADAATRAQQTRPRTIRIEARASATGTPEANKKLAETRSQVVSDALQQDGIARTILVQDPIGQASTTDPTVNERRVDIVLEH